MAFKKIIVMLSLLVIILVFTGTALAAEKGEVTVTDQNQECLGCHGAEDFAVTDQEGERSLYVDLDIFQHSVHGANTCVSCHPAKETIPHEKLTEAPLKEAVNQQCKTCHREVNVDYRASIHGRLAASGSETASCTDCHGTHDIRKKEDPDALVSKSNVSDTCMSCHDGEVGESYEESFHGKAVNLGSEKAATCADCHSGHKILGPLDPNSNVSKENVPATCAKCHFYERENFAKGAEHWTFTPTGSGAPMYWTLKFFTWLTIITITLLILHIELELLRKYREAGTKN